MSKELTPKNIVKELDKYIVSQDEAKKSVAISLRNRIRRKEIENEELRMEITPKNIILIGSTGVGKTEIARRLAKICGAPFVKVEATKYTEVGYVGGDVESIVKDLSNVAYKEIKERELKRLKEIVYSEALEKVAKAYRPLDVLNDEMKKNLIEEIKSGKLDSEMVLIETPKKKMPQVIELGADTPDIGEMISSIIASEENSEESVNYTIKGALDKFLHELSMKELKSMDINSMVTKIVEEEGIIFIDEIDKIVENRNSSGSEVSRQGVQRDILPIVEGCTVNTKFGPIKTDHILFIAAGAFSMSSPSDIMPELQGRFPVQVKLNDLNKGDLIKILTEVKYNLLEQYKEMLKLDKVDLDFSKNGIETIAEVAVRQNEVIENIGARRLHTVLEGLLRDIMYSAPYSEYKKILIDKKFVMKKFKNELEEENLDKYIL